MTINLGSSDDTLEILDCEILTETGNSLTPLPKQQSKVVLMSKLRTRVSTKKCHYFKIKKML